MGKSAEIWKMDLTERLDYANMYKLTFPPGVTQV